MSVVIERVQLYYREGRSDKIYEIELIAESEELFHVVGYNGRRGAQIVAQPKTLRAVPYATARRIFDALEQAKLNQRKTPYRLAGRKTFVALPDVNPPNEIQWHEQVPESEDYRARHLDALEL